MNTEEEMWALHTPALFTLTICIDASTLFPTHSHTNTSTQCRCFVQTTHDVTSIYFPPLACLSVYFTLCPSCITAFHCHEPELSSCWEAQKGFKHTHSFLVPNYVNFKCISLKDYIIRIVKSHFFLPLLLSLLLSIYFHYLFLNYRW